MPRIVVVASERDRPFADAIRAAVLERKHAGVDVSSSLPPTQDELVVLVWSAGLGAAHTIDGPALIALWSENRLVIARRDDTPLPLGMRDLPSLPPEAGPEDVRESIESSAGRETPTFSRPSPHDAVTTPEASSEAQRRVWKAPIFLALLVVVVLGGAYYYLTAEQRARQSTLTAYLESAAKVSEDLSKAKEAEIAAQLKLAEARAAEEAARNAGDVAKLKEAQDAVKRAEVEAAKQAELVKQREAAAAQTRDLAKKAPDAAKVAAAEKKATPKTVVAAPELKAEAPKTEATKVEAAKAEVAKADPRAEPRRVPRSRSEREAARDEEVAGRPLGRPQEPVAASAPAAPSAPSVPAGTDGEAPFQQAQAMEASDPRGALRIYRSLARHGNGKAAKRLGDIYDRGIPGVPRDYQESLSWYQKARDLGETIETASRRGDGPLRPVVPASPRPATETPKVAAAAPKAEPATTKAEPAPSPAPATDRKSTRLNSSHIQKSRMPSSA